MTDGAEEHCGFCDIAAGRDPSVEVVAEGERWIAFFPTEPATPGHTMVIPRTHVRDVWELDDDLGAALMSAVIDVGRAIRRGLGPPGMNLISSAGTAAEQTVFHVHLHLVPRWPDDGIDEIWPAKTPMDPAQMERIAQDIRGAWG